MAQVRRPVPFRTRKLRPGTAMVLHSTGCGRVARRRITRTGSSDTLKVPGLSLYPEPAPARTRTGTGTSPHTHETHARDHSRPAPTARPNGAARPRPWEPDARAPRSAAQTAPLQRRARNWLGYGVALHWLLLCITSLLNVALRRIKSCITIRRRLSVPLIKA